MKQRGHQISWWLILLELCLIIGGSIGTAFLLERFTVSLELAELVLQLLTLIPIFIGAVILKKIHPYGTLRDMIGIRDFDITMLLFFAFMPLCAQYFAGFVTAPVTVAVSEIFGEYDSGISAPKNLLQLGCLLVMTCVFAPVLEELLFRGVIMNLLEPYGFLTAAMVSSVGFAMLHLNPAGFTVILFLGFVLACIRYISGSVIACMAFHAFSNFYSLIMIVFEEQLMSMEKELVPLTGIGAVLFPILFILFYKIYPKSEVYSVTAKKIGASVGLIFCVIISAVYLTLLIRQNL